MSDIKRRAKIDEIRARLYERGVKPPIRPETHLIDEPVSEVANSWQIPQQPTGQPDSKPTAPVAPAAGTIQSKTRRRRFRRTILLSGLAFFVGTVIISTLVLFFGNNSISADNISISVNGPFTVSSGETLTLQIGVTNANAVPISAATLIIDYPEGVRKPDDNKNVFIERIPLETIRAGETINVPVRMVVFGEENSNQEIKVSIEYRVEGSNATFFRETEPFQYKISSAPIVLQTQHVERISANQETEIVLTVSANSQTSVNDVVVKADYPVGFEFVGSEPSPVRSNNIWSIKEVLPGEEVTISIRGTFTAEESDTLAIHFSAGAAATNDPTTIASVFSTVSAEVMIEHPFIDVTFELDGRRTNQLVIEPGDSASGHIVITNTLPDIVYDTEVRLQLGGNALAESAVPQTDGFFDPRTNTITWGPAINDRLVDLEPGESVRLSFALEPDKERATYTPTITLSASVESRRIRENRVPEVLTGSAEGSIVVATLPVLRAEARRISGPIPPTVDEVTEYTLSILAETASNNLNNAVVTTVLPPYVDFVAQTSGPGTISFNKSNRTVTWTIDTITVGKPVVGSFTVAFRPNRLQVGQVPVLMQVQRLRAEDAFTGSVVQAEHPAVTTEMSTELGFPSDNGRVVE